ncbi:MULTISPECIES: helix-turn-helix domain-containing protein [Chryseobacterium]|uniref:DNA-binding XRE family transcriptional regulator n=2 Tax=Chryseobacterium TaxID=59732 RepID=A0A543EJH4_9FLAO|nr:MULTISPECIES: helix-turn-helix transcriptional regulator [Chryseobacterium]MDR6458196.1 transcriptional regulator with XRE-family HTH domain [Chryseobacterium vietnamense]TQM21744.1 DNA-binding XRE family transcriptional regulator [Chryseobacterium aquifrigidense]
MYKWEVENLKFQIGKFIQVYRLRKELSQFQVGLELNISKDHIGRIERGLTNPTIENLVKLANFLEIDILILFKKLDDSELKRVELEIEHLQKKFKNQNRRKP